MAEEIQEQTAEKVSAVNQGSIETPKPSAEVPPDDRIALFESRLNAFETALHSEKTAHGRTKAQLRIATADKDGIFADAFAGYEEAKQSLLVHGYEESEIEALATASPKALKKLAAQVVPAPETSVELTAARTELAALKAQPSAAKPGFVPGPTRGASVPQGKSDAELADGIYDPVAMKARLREMGVRV
jgi:hypothetical protein